MRRSSKEHPDQASCIGFAKKPSALLVVDDDPAHRERVALHLRLMKFTVLPARTKDEALEILERHAIDLVLLEIGLGSDFDPDAWSPTCMAPLPGLQLLEIVRSDRLFMPVIVVSCFSSPIFELMAVRSGADAFLRKPADLNLLSAYIHRKLSVMPLQRTAHQAQDGRRHEAQAKPVFTVGRLLIDTEHRLIRVGDAPYQNLSATEAKLLALLAELPDKVFTRHELLERVWGVDAEEGYDAVEATIKRIRKKIEPSARRHRHLIAVRGLGYRLTG